MLLVKLALPALLVQPAPRAHKASKDPSVPRAPSASAGRLALPDRPDRSDRRVRRVRRVKPVAKAQLDPAANVDRQDRRAPLAQPDRRARRVTRARHRQFASSPVRIAFAAETTKSWLVLFARAVRPTERSARRPARHQPVYVHVDDLGHRVATSSTFSNSTMRWGNRVETRFAENELACAPKRPLEHRPRTSGAPISPHTPTPEFSYSLTLLRLRCFGSWAWILVCVGRWVAAGFWQPAPVSERKPKDWMAPGAFRERHKVMWRDRQFRSMRRVASTVGTIEPLRLREHP